MAISEALSVMRQSNAVCQALCLAAALTSPHVFFNSGTFAVDTLSILSANKVLTR